MKTKQKIMFISAILFIAVIYLNSLKAPLYFDDVSIINETLKIESFSLKNLYNVSFKGYAINRPFSNLTLALNYYFSKGTNPLQFHITNVLIHILAFIFVFLFIKELLALPSIPQKYRDKSLPIALISSLLWAVHPIQTQAVTYIIQRMSSLCTLFYFMCLYFYLKARTEKKNIYYFLSGISFFLSLGSKEIAATLPIAVFLIEWIFLRPAKKKLIAALLIIVLGLALLSYLFIGGELRGYIASLSKNKYSNRDFLISERLLTEPRVFAHYISLTIFPFYNRYILDYDFEPSRSLFFPISTLFALLFFLLTIFIGFFYSKKNKILSFCILCFWLGHAIEGSIFNLEIAFEHRMYLPSVFLILMVIALLADLADRIKINKKYPALFSAVLVIYLGTNTILRNNLWRDPIKFFNHNIKKTPQNYRPYHNLGVTYGMQGDYRTALEYFFKALSLNKTISITYFGIAQCYYTLGELEKSIPYYLKSLEMYLTYLDIYVNLSSAYLKLNHYEDALKIALEGLKKHPKKAPMMTKVGSIYYYTVQQQGEQGRELLEKHGIDEAKAFGLLDSAYLMGDREKDIFTNLPAAYAKKAMIEKSGENQIELMKKAEKILIEGLKEHPGDADIRNNLVGVYIMAGKWREALNIEALTKEDLNKLSLFLINDSQFSEALDVLKKAQDKFGLDQVIEFNQAICFYYTGNEENAVKIFKKIYDTTSANAIKIQANQFIKEWEGKHVQK